MMMPTRTGSLTVLLLILLNAHAIRSTGDSSAGRAWVGTYSTITATAATVVHTHLLSPTAQPTAACVMVSVRTNRRDRRFV
jgi:hypothetical protein